MECWICKQKSNKNNLCDCDNDYSYCHTKCVKLMIEQANIDTCIFCKKKYDLGILFTLKKNIWYIIVETYSFLEFIYEFDLINGIRWDEY